MRLVCYRMWKGLKRHWRQLRSSRPGRRFQEQYERHQRARQQHSGLRKFAQPAAGIFILALGAAFCVLPGPGIPFIIVGAALLAGESLLVARPMDRTELRIRKVLGWVRRQWSHATLIVKCTAVAAAACAIGLAGYGGYQVFVR